MSHLPNTPIFKYLPDEFNYKAIKLTITGKAIKCRLKDINIPRDVVLAGYLEGLVYKNIDIYYVYNDKYYVKNNNNNKSAENINKSTEKINTLFKKIYKYMHVCGNICDCKYEIKGDVYLISGHEDIDNKIYNIIDNEITYKNKKTIPENYIEYKLNDIMEDNLIEYNDNIRKSELRNLLSQNYGTTIDCDKDHQIGNYIDYHMDDDKYDYIYSFINEYTFEPKYDDVD